jgi:hypothetical protein
MTRANTDAVYDWLRNRPVLSQYRARLAALIAATMHSENCDVHVGWNQWLALRPDFFTAEAQNVVE